MYHKYLKMLIKYDDISIQGHKLNWKRFKNFRNRVPPQTYSSTNILPIPFHLGQIHYTTGTTNLVHKGKQSTDTRLDNGLRSAETATVTCDTLSHRIFTNRSSESNEYHEEFSRKRSLHRSLVRKKNRHFLCRGKEGRGEGGFLQGNTINRFGEAFGRNSIQFFEAPLDRYRITIKRIFGISSIRSHVLRKWRQDVEKFLNTMVHVIN